MYEYRAIIDRVVDGDTIDVDIDLGFDVWLKKQRVRLYRVDTPEKRTRNPIEKRAGIYASKVVEEFCPVGSSITLQTHYDATGKYGRILGEFITPEGTNINSYLLENRLAVEYLGQSKDKVREQQETNWEYLMDKGLIERL